MTSLTNHLQNRFQKLFGPTDEAKKAFEYLAGRYQNNRLAYHNLGHIYKCFARLDHDYDLADDHTLVQCAIWYHDAIYDPQRNDNEERSADLAAEELSKLKIDGANIDLHMVRDLILATKHNGTAESNNAKLLVDIDICILGAPWTEYLAYSRAIRKEYFAFDKEIYNPGRCSVLKAFLDRGDAMFHTERYRMYFGGQARANLSREIAMLSA